MQKMEYIWLIVRSIIQHGIHAEQVELARFHKGHLIGYITQVTRISPTTKSILLV